MVALVDISHLHRLADLERTRVGFLLIHYQAEQRGLARAVGTYHAHDAVGGQREFQVFEQQLLAERLLKPLGLNHLVAQARPVGDENLKLLLALLLVLVEQAVVARQTCLTLGLTRLGGHPHPFKLPFEGLAALAGLLLLLGHTLGLLVEP